MRTKKEMQKNKNRGNNKLTTTKRWLENVGAADWKGAARCQRSRTQVVVVVVESVRKNKQIGRKTKRNAMESWPSWFYLVWPGLTGFDRVLLGFTEFCRVLLGFTRFYRVFTEFYRVLPSFTGFYRVLTEMYRV